MWLRLTRRIVANTFLFAIFAHSALSLHALHVITRDAKVNHGLLAVSANWSPRLAARTYIAINDLAAAQRLVGMYGEVSTGPFTIQRTYISVLSGEFDEADRLIETMLKHSADSGSDPSTSLTAQLDQLASAAIRVSSEHIEQGNHQKGIRGLQFSLIHGRSAKTTSEALMNLAHAWSKVGQFDKAFQVTRRSFDVLPATNDTDSRLETYFSISVSLMKDSDCNYSPKLRHAALVTTYLQKHARSDDLKCVSKIESTLLEGLTTSLQAHLYRWKSRYAAISGQTESAAQLLKLAEVHGLNPGWLRAEYGSIFLNSTIFSCQCEPDFRMDSKLWRGLSFDPLQFESGLPIDVILYDRDGSSARIVYALPNMAPGGGFEYAEISCSYDPTCKERNLLVRDELDSVSIKGQITRRQTFGCFNLGTSCFENDNTFFSLRAGSPSSAGTTIATSYQRPISPRQGFHLVQFIRLRTEQASAYAGIQWHSGLKVNDSFIVSSFQDPQWHHFIAVVEPPQATSTSFSVIIVNWASSGIVHVDDLLVVEIPE